MAIIEIIPYCIKYINELMRPKSRFSMYGFHSFMLRTQNSINNGRNIYILLSYAFPQIPTKVISAIRSNALITSLAVDLRPFQTSSPIHSNGSPKNNPFRAVTIVLQISGYTPNNAPYVSPKTVPNMYNKKEHIYNKILFFNKQNGRIATAKAVKYHRYAGVLNR